MTGMNTDSENSTLDCFQDVALRGVQGLARARKFEQGINEVRHQVYPGSNLLVEFLALRGSEMTVSQEFGVGDNSSEGVAQIMRNGTGHPSDGGKLF